MHGTCFSLRPGKVPVSEGLTVTTRHEKLVMDQDILSSEMVASVGLAVAVVDTNVSPQAAMKSQVCNIYQSQSLKFCLFSESSEDLL